ncbi:MAG: hypothetical protein HY684_03720 [Chloroflexi bacterium]|nr:hypothetical protein [Chloroflexota bacterium]
MALVFLDPRIETQSERAAPALRLDSLKGKRLGILWNRRPMGDKLLRWVGESLLRKYQMAELFFFQKTYFGNAAPPDIIEALADKVDAAIVGVGD